MVYKCVIFFLGLQFFSIVQHVYLSFYDSCSVVKLEFGDCDSLSHSFIVKNCFDYSGLLPFQMNLRIVLVISCVEILMGIALKLQNAFGKIRSFNVLILPIHKHERSLQVFEIFLNFFLEKLEVIVIQVSHLFSQLAQDISHYLWLL